MQCGIAIYNLRAQVCDYTANMDINHKLTSRYVTGFKEDLFKNKIACFGWLLVIKLLYVVGSDHVHFIDK